ncbi:MAG: 16S rRNA (cytidine(1402)-2'-O)-methyltransferase [Clostridia bacterium]|nr:16S rRNA (cytidine(1402)-2'-O)-methyltransferase [Clostridia bacterium]
MKSRGILYIVGTPIGNMEDITIRALKTLKEVDVVLAEDTRQTLKLLSHYGIKKSLISYHRHNEIDKINQVISILDEGKKVALVSDAGMPIISDPGQALMQHLCSNNYDAVVIPGVTAVITGLVKCGLDASKFVFEGFLSVNKKQRREKLDILKSETRTTVFYEAPHKLLYTLKDMLLTIGNRKICIARELTKLHEEYIYTDIVEAIKTIEENGIKGEIVLIVEGANKEEIKELEKESLENISSKDMVLSLMQEEGIDKKEAIKKVAKIKGIHKNEVYKEVIDI